MRRMLAATNAVSLMMVGRSSSSLGLRACARLCEVCVRVCVRLPSLRERVYVTDFCGSYTTLP